MYYIGHKAHLRKVGIVLCSTRKVLRIGRIIIRLWLEIILAIGFKF